MKKEKWQEISQGMHLCFKEDTTMTMHELTTEERTIVNIAITAYINVFGESKWSALTVNEQHDAIMCMLSDLQKALERV